MSGNFYDEFSFWDSADPTNGFVAYQARSTAESQNLISGGSGNATFGVDSSNQAPNGRASVRLTSNKSYQSGLFILDVEHMPGGVCGTWPAFWMVGPDWPNQGEIDIIEGVNDQQSNDMTLHTGPGCTIGGGGSVGTKSAFTGSLESTSCVSGAGDNQGCQISTADTSSYGTGFNKNGGGVYATEWTSSAISIYFFPRGSVPSDVTGGSPNPSSWGEPMAVFSGGCDMSTSFTNQQIVFDTTFCGDWAGQVWDGSTCASKSGGSTCENYVANNPAAFKDAYWTVNGLKVYQNKGGSAPAPSSKAPPAPTNSGWGNGGQSTFQTHSAPPAPPTSAPASGIGQVSGVPQWPVPSSAPASSIGEVSGVPQWPAPSRTWGGGAHHTWGGGAPWQSGGWTEVQNDDGAFVVGAPVPAQSNHARHLAKHKRHRAGRL